MKPDRGLDVCNLLIAATNAAYGSFIPVYLTTMAWTETQIGAILTVVTVASILTLVPAGMLVDALRSRQRALLVIGLAANGLVPLLLLTSPTIGPASLGLAVQALLGSLLSPTIAAISLSVVGHHGLSERLGRNARYGSIGAGLGAAILGACSTWGPAPLVFLIALTLLVPTLLSTRFIGPDLPVIDTAGDDAPNSLRAPIQLLRDRRVIVFAAALALFQVASIAVIQLAAVEATRRMGSSAGLIIAAFVVVPQVVAAWLAPWIGRLAERSGRRRVLLAGFSTVPLRGLFFTLIHNPFALIPVQVLEGIGGGIFGVMMPLVAADLTRGNGFFTSCMGLFGLASSIGTGISTSLAGWVADHAGRPAAFCALTLAGVASVLILLLLPETAPTDQASPDGGGSPNKDRP